MTENEPLIKFKVPEGGEIKAYLLKDKEGRYTVRTEDEIEKKEEGKDEHIQESGK